MRSDIVFARGARLLFAALLALVPLLGVARAEGAGACADVVSQARPAVTLAAYRARVAETEPIVGLSFLGHSSFLITSPAGVTIVTDYNGFLRPKDPPDVVTMNHAHTMHYTDDIDPGIKLVLRGWDTGEGPPHYDVKFGDVRIRNVPTNIRAGDGGTEYGGNSIFIFATGDLCIAHLGHLHHTLTPEHLAELGRIDVLLTPIDGAFTLSQNDMIEVIDAIHPALVFPMHYFGQAVLDRFVKRVGDRYAVHYRDVAALPLERSMLPAKTEVWVLPGN
ncbi:MAG TPA: MBL fold metallo-hydrolase [Stellaceae bacterium]|nr:MBL fold metallo-hydrolase [Stellaceae bacterium]